MTGTERPAVPVPTSVSEAARQFLAQPPPRRIYPAADDVRTWERLIADGEALIRDRFQRLVDSSELPLAVEDRDVAGVPTYVARLADAAVDDPGPVYLDLHGGSLIMGGGDLCRLMTCATAMKTRMVTWGVDYRMPPLHPYPAALDDCLAVYRVLLQGRDAADVFVGGQSAGGNLAAALMLRAREEGLPMPAALVLDTPELDLTESGDTFQTLRDADTMLASLREPSLLYADGHDLADPHLSPLFADVTGFPPTFLQSGTRDLFLSNTVRMHRKLRAAGVDAELHVFEAMPHGGFGGTTPEDLEAAAEKRRFLDRHRRRE